MAGLRLLAAAVVFAALTSDALAGQGRCAERDRFVSHLASVYGERPVAAGHPDAGGVIELLRSATRKSWTIIWTDPDGIACLVAAGEDWEPSPALLVGLDGAAAAGDRERVLRPPPPGGEHRV